MARANLPTQWSETENVIWYTPSKRLGWSSPVIVGDRIYCTSAENAESDDPKSLAGAQRLFLECYDKRNGELVFERMVFEQGSDAPSIHKKNSHASPTILAYQGNLFLHFGHQGTICVDRDGNKVWESHDHPYPPTHGNGGSPIIADDKLIVTCDGGNEPYTLALDPKTGKEIWRTPRKTSTTQPFSFATPQYIEVEGQGQIISPGSSIVQSISPKDGSVIWSVEYFGFSVIPRPVYHQGLVLVCTGYMTPKLLAIDPTGHGDVTKSHVKWTVSTSVPNTPSVVPCGDQIVMVSDGGVASGIRVESGKKIWQKRIGGNYSASPLAIGNRVFFQSETGEASIYDIDAGAELVGKGELPGRIFASYAVDGDDLLIRAEAGLYRIGKSSK